MDHFIFNREYYTLVKELLLTSTFIFTLSAQIYQQRYGDINLNINPDTLFFSTSNDLDKDITLTNISEDTISLDSLTVTSNYFLYYYFPHDFENTDDIYLIMPHQSIFIEVSPALPVEVISEGVDYIIDTLFIYTSVDDDSYLDSVLLILDPSIISSVDNKKDRSLKVNGFLLNQNYPNPFNNQTTIQYCLSHAGYIDISIYDLSGQKIQTLVSGNKPAGNHQIHWNTDNIASGIYIYELITSHGRMNRKCILLK